MQKAETKKLLLKNVRLSFPSLDKPRTPKGYENTATPKYGATFLIDPSTEEGKNTIRMISADIKRIIKEQWGTKPPRMKPIEECFGKGEYFVNRQTNKPYDGYDGMWAVVAKNAKRPLLIDRDKTPLSDEEVISKLYAGCYVDAIVHFYPQPPKHGDAIRCSLDGVRFVRDGEAFGGAVASVDDFDDDLPDGDIDFGDDDDQTVQGNDDALGLDDEDDDIPF